MAMISNALLLPSEPFDNEDHFNGSFIDFSKFFDDDLKDEPLDSGAFIIPEPTPFRTIDKLASLPLHSAFSMTELNEGARINPILSDFETFTRKALRTAERQSVLFDKERKLDFSAYNGSSKTDYTILDSNIIMSHYHAVSPLTFLKTIPSTSSPLGNVSPPRSSLSTCSVAKTPYSININDAFVSPVRALSAYNFFFRDERERILNGGEEEYTSDKQRRLLDAHWNRDRSKKRRHRKSHGKISFTTLSKLISQRWKDLTDEKKQFYRDIAAKDWDRYQHELNVYQNASIGGHYQAVIG